MLFRMTFVNQVTLIHVRRGEKNERGREGWMNQPVGGGRARDNKIEGRLAEDKVEGG